MVLFTPSREPAMMMMMMTVKRLLWGYSLKKSGNLGGVRNILLIYMIWVVVTCTYENNK